MPLALAGCGGGGSDATTDPAPPAEPVPIIIYGTQVPANVNWQPQALSLPANGNYLYVESDADDPVGQGRTRLYTSVAAVLSYFYNRGNYGLTVAHPEIQWSGEFGDFGTLRAGLYVGAVPVDQRGSLQPAMSWRATGTRCDQPGLSWYVIDEVVDNGSGLERLVVRFSQSCNGGRSSLRGKFRWNRGDQQGPRIAVPPPGLWQPPADALPATGSYAYFESTAGDHVGGGNKRLFTARTATLDAYFVDSMAAATYAFVVVSPDETWASPIGTSDLRAIQPGYYPGLDRLGYGSSPAVMEWARNGKACGRQNGWLLIESVSFVGDLLVGIEFRFEQRCGLSQAPLRGKVKWSIFDFLLPKGPDVPAPSNLWRAPAGAIPATGSYAYFQSSAGDVVGEGQQQTHQGAGAQVNLLPTMGGLQMRVAADLPWTLEFLPMKKVVDLRPGYYAVTSAWPRTDRNLAAMSVTRGGRACPGADSERWLVIDRVDRDAEQRVASVEFRFGQRCSGSAAWLYGQVRWEAVQPLGLPVAATPEGLWRPPAGATPDRGNFLYVEGDYEDALTGGSSTLFEEKDVVIVAGTSGLPATFGMSVLDGARNWSLAFRAAPELLQLRPGLYANQGGRALDASASAWSCQGQSTSWFHIDSISYDAEGIAAVELRFEHACPPGYGSSRGQLRWVRAERVTARAPVWPVPATLWQPPASALPATGNYLYVESEYGDVVGQGRTQLFTEANARLAGLPVSPPVPGFGFTVQDAATAVIPWRFDLEGMQPLERLERGLYANVAVFKSARPAKGGFHLLTGSASCNTIDAWFAVDEVSYAGGVIDAISLRFEQYCDRRSGALRGQFKWRR